MDAVSAPAAWLDLIRVQSPKFQLLLKEWPANIRRIVQFPSPEITTTLQHRTLILKLPPFTLLIYHTMHHVTQIKPHRANCEHIPLKQKKTAADVRFPPSIMPRAQEITSPVIVEDLGKDTGMPVEEILVQYGIVVG